MTNVLRTVFLAALVVATWAIILAPIIARGVPR